MSINNLCNVSDGCAVH